MNNKIIKIALKQILKLKITIYNQQKFFSNNNNQKTLSSINNN